MRTLAERLCHERRSIIHVLVRHFFKKEGRSSGEEKRDVYLDTMDGLCELRLTAEETNDVREVYHEWSRPWTVYELVLKKNVNGVGSASLSSIGTQEIR